jgi:hypothetical protein
MFLKCIGQTIAEQGFRGALALVPLDEKIYDIAANSIDRSKKKKAEAQVRADAEAMLNATSEEIKRQARQIALDVLPGGSEAEAKQLELYLTQVPSVVRQSLKRPGSSVSIHWHRNAY